MSQVTREEILAPAPRVVKPRKRSYRVYPIIAISGDLAVDEQGGTISVAELIDKLPSMPPTLFVKLGAADWLAGLNPYFTKLTPNWQWRASNHERDIVTPSGKKVAARVSVSIHFFGWKGRNYHKLIDPVTMYGRKLDEIWPGTETEIIKLLKWAIQLRDFCAENNVDIRPTSGSIGAQFLTDKRFYSKPRRKVPAATNEQAREHMPGNYYKLNVVPSNRFHFSAYYFDQQRAHHYHAERIHFPDADRLYAFGRFQDLGAIVSDKPYSDFNGLLCVDLRVPRKRPQYVWLKGVTRDTRYIHKQFVFTNELPYLTDMGFKVMGVRAAWGSRRRDEGLPKYAKWCQEQLDRFDDPPWLKPVLLSTYGILAAKPRYGESVFRMAKGEPVTIRTGRHKLEGVKTRTTRKLESKIATVIHRGMIEAATRCESIAFAEWLSSLSQRVLSIYADAVIVEANDDRPLPDLLMAGEFDPWRNKQTLNHLQFINQQAFISDGMVKLPGVGKELSKYRQPNGAHAPRVVKYEALTNKRVVTDRRI